MFAMKTTLLSITRLTGIALISLLTVSCVYGPANRIEGEGPERSKTLELDPVNGIVIKNSARVFLTQGPKQEIVVRGQENIIRNLDTTVSGGIWNIRNIKPVWRMQPLVIEITTPDIRMLQISGSGNIRSEEPFRDLDNLELGISGSGDIHIDMECRQVYARISGSGGIHLSGTGEKAEYIISGSGSIRASDLTVSEARTRISGSGSIYVHAEEDLDASISGSGDIIYEGRPRINTRSSGSGKVYAR